MCGGHVGSAAASQSEGGGSNLLSCGFLSRVLSLNKKLTSPPPHPLSPEVSGWGLSCKRAMLLVSPRSVSYGFGIPYIGCWQYIVLAIKISFRPFRFARKEINGFYFSVFDRMVGCIYKQVPARDYTVVTLRRTSIPSRED